MSHFVAYILQFQEIIVYKIPPGGGGGSIASLRSKECTKTLLLGNYHRWNFLFVGIYIRTTVISDSATSLIFM